jgi:hypothetical protein
VARGWVAVTPVGLRSDIPLTANEAASRTDGELVDALGTIINSVAEELKVQVAGLPDGKSSVVA